MRPLNSAGTGSTSFSEKTLTFSSLSISSSCSQMRRSLVDHLLRRLRADAALELGRHGIHFLLREDADVLVVVDLELLLPDAEVAGRSPASPSARRCGP